MTTNKPEYYLNTKFKINKKFYKGVNIYFPEYINHIFCKSINQIANMIYSKIF